MWHLDKLWQEEKDAWVSTDQMVCRLLNSCIKFQLISLFPFLFDFVCIWHVQFWVPQSNNVFVLCFNDHMWQIHCKVNWCVIFSSLQWCMYRTVAVFMQPYRRVGWNAHNRNYSHLHVCGNISVIIVSCTKINTAHNCVYIYRFLSCMQVSLTVCMFKLYLDNSH